MLYKLAYGFYSLLQFVLFYLFPKKNNKWVFSGFANSYSDYNKYIYEHVATNEQDINAIWITSCPKVYNELKRKGLAVYKKHSLLGVYHVNTAGVFCYSSYVSDIGTFPSLRAYKVNFWHGCPYKMIEKDIKKGPLRKIYNPSSFIEKIYSRIFHFEKNISPDLMFYSDDDEKQKFSSAFSSKKLIRHDSIRKIASIKRAINVREENEKIKILLALTWRSKNSESSIRNIKDLISVIKNIKGKDLSVHLKLHPAMSKYYGLFEHDSNVVVLPHDYDINDKTLSYDLLVTDYSSIIKNFLECEKSFLLYADDFEDYRKEDREFYESSIEFFDKNLITSIDEFSHIIADYLKKSNNTHVSRADLKYLNFNSVVKEIKKGCNFG
ncbi:CDP-glycerol glycerophosphotransferase family protein [Vibrio owensii]